MATLAERRERLQAAIPRLYSGALHLLGINLFGLAAIAACVWQLERPPSAALLALDVALAPAALVFANAFEWWVHKGPLHRPAPLLGRLYRRHACAHHVMFTDDRMAVANQRELALVLFPPYVFPLLLVLVSPLVGALYLLRPNLAFLFLAAALGYYLLYEWLHLCHHLPAESWIGRRGWVRALRRHHLRHHDPARMTRGNFNVSFPLTDWLVGSTLGAAEEAVSAPSRSPGR